MAAEIIHRFMASNVLSNPMHSIDQENVCLKYAAKDGKRMTLLKSSPFSEKLQGEGKFCAVHT
jgi:hypothetical protein